MIEIIQGDILNANEEYICQQCNCISVRPHGLSASIANKYPHANPYSIRRPMKGRNMAISSDIATPGSIQVFGSGIQRKVICMFAQYGMGKPYAYGNTTSDSSTDRLQWFSACLERISEMKPGSIAFPYNIGCGLAGGNWTLYSDILYRWSENHPEIVIRIYKL